MEKKNQEKILLKRIWFYLYHDLGTHVWVWGLAAECKVSVEQRTMAAEVQSCPVCLNESFSTAGDLILAFVGFLQRPLTCPLCSALAPDASTLSQHLLLHLPPRQSEVVQVSTQQQTQYDCKQCQSFHTPDLSALRLHVEAAHPERKFLCVQCLKLFKGMFVYSVLSISTVNKLQTYLQLKPV